MAEPSLTGVWAKIARAKAHRDILDKKVSGAFKGKVNRPRVGIKFDPQTQESVVYVSKMRDFGPLLEECALISGDLLNNLRSALDYLAYQLAIKCTRDNIKRPHKVQFPLCSKRGNRTIRGSFWQKAKTDLGEVRGYQTRIEALQPYKRRNIEPNRSLGLLRDYNDPEKHRLLLPSVVALNGYSFGLNLLTYDMLGSMSTHPRDPRRWAQSNAGPLLVKLQPWEPITLGAELYRFTAAPERMGMEMKMIGEATPTVTLGKRYSLVKLCDVLIAAVAQVPSIFEDAFE